MKAKEFLKENKKTILGILILGLITYGIKLIKYSFSIDTEVFLVDRTGLLNSWITIDRYGLVLIKKIIDFANINLYLANFVGFITLFLSIIVCVYNVSMISSNKDKRVNILLRSINNNKSNYSRTI